MKKEKIKYTCDICKDISYENSEDILGYHFYFEDQLLVSAIGSSKNTEYHICKSCFGAFSVMFTRNVAIDKCEEVSPRHYALISNKYKKR